MRAPVLALALSAALALPAAAGAVVTPRIVNGTTSTTEELPYAAGLLIAIRDKGDDSPDALCGGTLVAARWIVTAAHCLVEEPIDLQRSYAVLGATSLDTSPPETHYAFAEALVPQAYATGGGGYDLGLVRLARPAPQPQLRLLRPAEADLFAAGSPALTAGWGYTEDPEDGGVISSGQLRKVDLQIYSDQQCQDAFAAAGEPNGLDFATEVCALAPSRDSCNGDSGGPLIVADAFGQPALAGAVSFGIGSGNALRGSRSCNEGPPGVYSRLGADPLNTLIRNTVPQVEIDADVATPVPGEKVTFTASPTAPGGSGPFGGYDTIAWDLDGDGAFAERTGQLKASLAVPPGTTAVAARATSAAGDAETRTIRVVTQDKSAVSFATGSASVRAGHTVRLRVNRIGTGAGSVRVNVSGHGVRPRHRTVSFSGTEASRTVKLRARHGSSSRVTVSLGAYAGAVVAGTRTRLKLRIRR